MFSLFAPHFLWECHNISSITGLNSQPSQNRAGDTNAHGSSHWHLLKITFSYHTAILQVPIPCVFHLRCGTCCPCKGSIVSLPSLLRHYPLSSMIRLPLHYFDSLTFLSLVGHTPLFPKKNIEDLPSCRYILMSSVPRSPIPPGNFF